MAPNVTAHFFAANDINGDVLHEITDEDTFFQALTLKPERDGLGSADLLLNRTINFAGFASGTFGVEVFVRFLVHAYSDTVYYPWGLSLSKRQQVVVHRNEKGAETFRFGGPGPKSLLSRHALGIHSNMAGEWNVDLTNGVWRWTENATIGQILNRILDEDQARPAPSLPFLTTTFNASTDSDAVAWADADLASDGLFEIPIGTDYLTILRDMDDLVELSSWIDLGTVATPKFELNVIQGLGADRTGSAVGSGVVLLKEGLNIANDSLTVEGQSLRKVTHVIVEGKDGAWTVAVRPGWSDGDYVKYDKISYTRTSSTYWLEKAGQRWLRKQDIGEREITVEIVPGVSDATGYYFPAPDRNLWLDNVISVDTSADGTTHSQLDIDPGDDQLVTGFELELGPAGETATSDQKAKSWNVKTILNRERSGVQTKTPSQASGSSGGSCRCTNGPPFPHECEPEPGDTLITDTDDAGWIGSLESGDGFTGDHRATGASGGTSGDFTVTAGQSYRLILRLGGSAHKYTGYIRLADTPNVLTDIDLLVVDQIIPGGHGDVTTIEYSFTVPTGYNIFRFRHLSKLGGWRYQAELYEVADPIEQDPNCIPAGTGGELPIVPRYDDPRFTNPDQHDTSRIISSPVNNSGGTLNRGDVVTPDITFDGEGVTTVAAASSTTGVFGVVLSDSADDGDPVRVQWFGPIAYVRDTGTAADGQYLFTSTTPGAANTGTFADGAFGWVVRDESGDVAFAFIWGRPMLSGGGGGGSVATDAIWDAKGDLAAGTGANTAAKLTVGADDTILMADSGETTGLKWVASQTPSTQAFGDAAAQGTADTYARGDHKHAMPATPSLDTLSNVVETSPANGDALAYDGTDWDNRPQYACIPVALGGAGVTLVTGEVLGLKVTVPFKCTILRWDLMADQTGSVVVDIWKDTFGNFPPANADSITGSAKPTLSSARSNQSSTLTGWTTTINADDVLAFEIESVTTITQCTLNLIVKRIY